MNPFHIRMLFAILLLAGPSAFAQTIVSGKIIDINTHEPIAGASIHCIDSNCTCGCTANAAGYFEMHCRDCRQLQISSIGYAHSMIAVSSSTQTVYLSPKQFDLQQIVVSASRGEQARRSEAPVAISTISAKTMQETKATSADQLLNKISGVNMVNLGNEQHQMSIRQPMTTKSLFLYLEDGIPIRSTGLFNHNALLEMNLAATKSIEVIKGPSSSLYGSEAIGGVINFISQAPAAIPLLKVSLQGNTIGLKRTDLSSSFQQGKWGFALSGYYAGKHNGPLDFTDFHKGVITARIDYRIDDRTSLSNSMTLLHYYSDMPGGIDSSMFASRSFKNPQTFTYREVHGLRYHSTLTRQWSSQSKTTLTALFRDNRIGQNPAYRIRDDYHRQGNGFVGQKDLAHGEINESRFSSYAWFAQHRQAFNWKSLILMAGTSIDLSPSGYLANYIRVKKDSLSGTYQSYQQGDSVLSNYTTGLNNYAAFIHMEVKPAEKLKLVASLRYDLFQYRFNNALAPSAFSGSADTSNRFRRVSPKIGFTYNFTTRTGFYANYSEGFVPPQVTEMYIGVKVPDLKPALFYNYEAGGWAELIKGKLSADFSAYILEGVHEIISVKLDDGSYQNQNAGKTTHRGIEFGLNGNPVSALTVRVSGALSKHLFKEFIEKGNDYSGNEMNNAPRWIYNAELGYKPAFLKGLRLSAEWQHVGSYFINPQNSGRYTGYDILNLRFGYTLQSLEIWANLLNATNQYYSYLTTKSAFGYSYQLADPVNINLGIAYDFGKLFKKK